MLCKLYPERQEILKAQTNTDWNIVMTSEFRFSENMLWIPIYEECPPIRGHQFIRVKIVATSIPDSAS